MIDTLLQVPALAGATTYHLITAGQFELNMYIFYFVILIALNSVET